jgi:phenylpropionate dioxygenase-like ring-hydroxylating dioxygenase large terminal subunit
VPNSSPIESVLWDDWHVVVDLARLRQFGQHITQLLGRRITLEIDSRTDRVDARLDDARIEAVEIKYGYVWICLGKPTRDIVEFAECRDADRLVATAGSIRVAVSGLRAVENFLDLSHLAFVHAGYLGEEPFTEIKQYSVESSLEGGVLATGCSVYQPKASPIADQGFDVDYIYAVVRPYVVVLYKANPVEMDRKDVIALFVQPETEESCVAHMLTCYLKHGIDPAAVRNFQQFIFGQDRPILENQVPKRLPLSPRSEIQVRADVACATYRRWLGESGVRFGAIPAA